VKRQVFVAACVAALLSIVGCSGAPEQVGVSGKVTFDGTPVEDGQIEFEPQGAGGRMAFAMISGGQYATAQERGIQPGKYLVRITASRPTGKAAEQDSFNRDATAVVNEQFIPAKYNSASDLQIEIGAAGAATHDFALTSK
jgi:hypothetical protein